MSDLGIISVSVMFWVCVCGILKNVISVGIIISLLLIVKMFDIVLLVRFINGRVVVGMVCGVVCVVLVVFGFFLSCEVKYIVSMIRNMVNVV